MQPSFHFIQYTHESELRELITGKLFSGRYSYWQHRGLPSTVDYGWAVPSLKRTVHMCALALFWNALIVSALTQPAVLETAGLEYPLTTRLASPVFKMQ